MNILLTRALNQVKPLADLLDDGTHKVFLFPTLKTIKLTNTTLKNHYDVAIFISANAVEYGLSILNHLKFEQIFAVGPVTAKALSKHKFEVVAFPRKNASSEALLAIPEVHKLVDKNILIFRGKGGRETLKEGLQKNNSVEYIEVYQRIKCDITPQHHITLTKFLQQDTGVIITTSVENLDNMMSIIAQINAQATHLIKRYPLVVLSKRIKTYAQSIGFRQIKVAIETSDYGLLQAVKSM